LGATVIAGVNGDGLLPCVAFCLGVRTVIESDQKTQSQRDYLPALDTSTNQAKQQSRTLHIGTHILSESSKDNTFWKIKQVIATISALNWT
jgi:hypothetical protein